MKVYILLVACERFAIWESATVVLTGNKVSHTFVGQPIAVAGRYVKMWSEISLAVHAGLEYHTHCGPRDTKIGSFKRKKQY